MIQRKLKFLLFTLAPIPLLASLQPNLSSDKPIQLDQENQSMVAEGNANLVGKDFIIKSDKISFFKNEGKIQADKNVSITRSDMRLTADLAEYDFKEKQISTTQFHFGVSPLFVSGEQFFANGDKVEGDRATIHYQEPDGYEPNIQAKRLYFDRLTETARIEGATFRAGSIPFFYLPDFEFTAGKAPFDPGLSLGYATHLGGYAKSDLWLQMEKDLYAGGFLNFYSKRGFMLGPKVRYGDPSRLSTKYGDWSAGFIQDWNEPGLDRYGNGIDQDRFYIKGVHKQNIKDGVDFMAQLDWRDDAEIFRDFDYGYFRNNQDADTFFEGNYEKDNLVVSVFGRFRPNYFEPVIERLPQVTYTYLPSSIGKSSLVHQGNLQLSHIRQESPKFRNGSETSKRISTYYQVSNPIRHDDWFNFKPLLGAQATHYFESANNDDSYTRAVGEIGFDLSLLSHATWNIDRPVWKINGVRHLVKPTVQYRYLPGKDEGTNRIPQIDDSKVRLTRIDPLGLGDDPSVDLIQEIHKTRIGIENTIQTRHTEYGSRTLVRANVYQDIHHARNLNEDTFDSFYSEIELLPASWLSLDFLSRVKTQDLTSESFSSLLTLKDGDRKSLGFGTEMLHNEVEEYFVSTSLKIHEGLGVSSRITYDAQDQEFSELLGGLDTMIGRYWKLSSTLGYQEDSERIGSWRIDMNVRLLSF